MTESEWLATTDPEPMIWFIRKQGSERRQRLAACACYRAEWAEDRQFEWVITAGERYADGECDEAEARAAFEQAMGHANPQVAMRGLEELEIFRRMVGTALCVNPIPNAPLSMLASEEPKRTGFLGTIRKAIGSWLSFDEAVEPEKPKHPGWCDFIRDIFGNPFRPVTISPAVLAWNDCVVVRLARGAYDGRQLPNSELDPQRVTVLADALEEAGAPDELVTHLRGSGPHVRGCFVADLCLGLS